VSIGSTLAEARRSAGLTIAQVSEKTRIRETIIREIESDDYAACGGDFYARGHVRAIARVVGTDPVPLIAEYDANLRAPEEITAAEAFQPAMPADRRRPASKREPASRRDPVGKRDPVGQREPAGAPRPAPVREPKPARERKPARDPAAPAAKSAWARKLAPRAGSAPAAAFSAGDETPPPTKFLPAVDPALAVPAADPVPAVPASPVPAQAAQAADSVPAVDPVPAAPSARAAAAADPVPTVPTVQALLAADPVPTVPTVQTLTETDSGPITEPVPVVPALPAAVPGPGFTGGMSPLAERVSRAAEGAASRLAAGASQLAGGASRLAARTPELAGGVSRLASRTPELAARMPGLAGRMRQLAASRPQLAGRTPRPNWTIVLAVALLAAIGVLGYNLAGSSGSPRSTAQAGGSTHPAAGQAAHDKPRPAPARAAPAPSPTAAQAQPLSPVSVTAFGPGGAGQGDNPNLAPLAITSNPSAGWHSDWYSTASFGDMQSGTGLLLDMGKTVTVTSAQMTLGSPSGADLQLRAGDSPSLTGLSPVVTASNVGGDLQLSLSKPVTCRYVLIWFTGLPPDPSGTFQASVSDVRLAGQT
jgi:X-X-X-Leu-X-X-Gly heptad repeat protein